MNKLNKFPRAIFTIAMMLIVAFPSLAHDFEVNGIYYKYLDKIAKTVAVTYKDSPSSSLSEYTGSVTIPSSVTYNSTTYSVTEIGEEAFRNCGSLTSVTIPNSVTEIGEEAFRDCISLTQITIPNSVTKIGSYAFNNSSWYNNQPDGVIYAGKVLIKYKGIMPNNTSINTTFFYVY